MNGITYFDWFLAFGVVWVPVTLVLLTEPEGRRAPKRMLFWCIAGWLSTFGVFAALGALGA